MSPTSKYVRDAVRCLKRYLARSLFRLLRRRRVLDAYRSIPGSKDERGPDDDLRLQFEATARLSDDEKRLVREVIESILLRHEAKRWAA